MLSSFQFQWPWDLLRQKLPSSALSKWTKMIPEQSLTALLCVFKRGKDEATFKTILSIIYKSRLNVLLLYFAVGSYM